MRFMVAAALTYRTAWQTCLRFITVLPIVQDGSEGLGRNFGAASRCRYPPRRVHALAEWRSSCRSAHVLSPVLPPSLLAVHSRVYCASWVPTLRICCRWVCLACASRCAAIAAAQLPRSSIAVASPTSKHPHICPQLELTFLRLRTYS
jgi:hypothetical protein